VRPIELSVEIDRPATQVWAGLVDWPAQGAWMPMTKVEVVGGGPGHGLGERIVAWTGVRPLAVADRMTISEWDPPRRLTVTKTGRVLQGSAWFEVVALSEGRSRLTWCEDLTPPFGAAGRVLSPFLSVGTRAVIGLALRRYARYLTKIGA
jgi:hypothetical protein